MLDNPLITLIISIIIAGESAAGISNTPVKQAFQPTQQGINTGPTAYMFKVADKRKGWPQKSDVWDKINSIMVHKELQEYETTFQISTLSTQDPKNPAQYTPSDILNLIAYILQNDKTIQTLTDNGLGILRIGDVRNPYFTDDRQRFESNPSLDFVITHKQIVYSENPVVQSEEFVIKVV